MRKPHAAPSLLAMLLLSLQGFILSAAAQSAAAPRPIELKDITAWKSLRSVILSNDGQWLAYRLSPAEGDGEIVVRKTREAKELKYPAGEIPAPPPAAAGGPPPQAQSGSDIAFSADSKWLSFTIYPSGKEAKRLKKENKPLYNKTALLEMATEKKLEFDKVRRAAFSGENPAWFTLHRYPSESQSKEKEKWSGSDLILRELATGAETNFGNVAEVSFDKKGQWMAIIVDAQDKAGNGVLLRNMATGVLQPLDSGKANYKGLNWTKKGDGLAVLKGIENKSYEDKLYSLLGFTGFGAGAPVKTAFDPAAEKSFPAGMSISPDRTPFWMADLSAMVFGIHPVKDKKDDQGVKPADEASKESGPADSPKKDEVDRPDLVIWHWLDKRLQSQQQVEENQDKNFSFVCLYRVAEKKFLRLADDSMRRVTLDPEYRFAVGLDDREYQLMGALDGRRYQDVYALNLQTGARTPVIEKARWFSGASPDGSRLLYYDDGHYYVYDMAAARSINITKQVPTSFIDTEDDHNVVKPPVRAISWSKDSSSVLLYDNWDVWHVPVDGGMVVNLTLNGRKEMIHYGTRFNLDPEERGIDLSGDVYFGTLEEKTKKGGIAVLEKGMAPVKALLSGEAAFSTLRKAKEADTLLYTRETWQDYPDYYVTDSTLQNGQRVSQANPQQKDFLWSSGSRLIEYVSDKGDKLQAALFLPANYEAGKSYPAIVYIYEKLTSGLNRYTAPTSNGFNKSVYTSNGYAVLMPDIVYKINDPGMSAVWCVIPALKAAIATGVVDAARVGIHGHSWGGYQTAFLVTQTDMFRAAIAGAPLTNMISMYSSIYWNSGGGNMSIFESSQGRFTGGYWDNLDAYARNSPVYFAKNVRTPLLILHNDKDGAVDWNQGIEYYNTLRRLQKPVVMLQYKGENHGLRIPANQKDYTVRMKEFFDHHLMGKAAPGWLTEGVEHLKLKEHIDARTAGKPGEKTAEKPAEKPKTPGF